MLKLNRKKNKREDVIYLVLDVVVVDDFGSKN